jgi:hypothetical protein
MLSRHRYLLSPIDLKLRQFSRTERSLVAGRWTRLPNVESTDNGQRTTLINAFKRSIQYTVRTCKSSLRDSLAFCSGVENVARYVIKACSSGRMNTEAMRWKTDQEFEI